MLAKGAKLTVLAVKVSILAIAVAFLYGLTTFYLFGGRFLGLEEKGVLITDVEINTGETVTPDILMGWLGVERDAPLFASRRFGANDLRAAMVRAMANPTLASLYVSREFTGKVTIHATERKPLARIAGRGLAIDRDGARRLYEDDASARTSLGISSRRATRARQDREVFIIDGSGTACGLVRPWISRASASAVAARPIVSACTNAKTSSVRVAQLAAVGRAGEA